MRILLLAHTFPPYSAIGAVRATKLAEHLLAAGHDVRVLTGAPLPYPSTLAETFPAERVAATPWLRIEAPLDWLRARIGQHVSRTVAASGPAEAASGQPPRPSLVARGVIAYRSLLSVPDAQAGWIPYATAAGRRLLANWVPELIYSSALPFSSHVVAQKMARAAGCPWVGEYRDLYSGNPYTDLWPRRLRRDQSLESRVVSSAAALVAISPPMTEYLAELHQKPTATIMNGYDPADLARAADMSASFDPAKLNILYTGIIYPGRRDPAVLFEALRRLGPERGAFEAHFYGQALEQVPEAAARAGVGDVVRTFAAIPYREALGLQKAADVLLLLLWDSPLEKGVLTGKLFEYAGAGRPVLSLGCEDGAAADLIRERGLGLTSNDPDRVATFLREMLALKQREGRTRPLGGPDAARGLTRRDQFLALERFLTDEGLLRRGNAEPNAPTADRADMPC